MNLERKQDKRIIREFLRGYYSDEKLAMLLAHAQSGRLAYFSCCCLVGFPYGDHSAEGFNARSPTRHPITVSKTAEGRAADAAFYSLGLLGKITEMRDELDSVRRRRLIPMIKAEMKRRERERQLTASCEASALSKDTVSVS